jgi:hypothetical protein
VNILRRRVYSVVRVMAALLGCAVFASAATITVPAGGDLQAAITAARPGDTILLAAGATYVGNFKLPVHGGTTYITIRSAAPADLLPGTNERITPAHAPHLPKIVSPNNMPAIRTVHGAAYWNLSLLEVRPSTNFSGEAIALGDGSLGQSSLAKVAHHLVVDRVYVHGDPTHGLRRGIALNSAHTTIRNSHIADIKDLANDTQAIGGWNGPGPYTIQNNYLEASGEVVMFGGADPAIVGLVPADITIRGNTITRPLSWRAPLVGTPGGLSVVAVTTGSLPAGTYGYRVLARRQLGGYTARSLATSQATVTKATTGGIRIQWAAVSGAAEYLVYGRTPNGQTRYWRTTSTSFVDTGSDAGTAGTVPTSASVWLVKNLLELKNARRVTIDYNVLENHWRQAQAGTAILFTPRNQGGACTWCVVESVTFAHNVVRKAGSGIMVLGWDDERPSARLNGITIRHNLFSEIGSAWGGTGHFIFAIDGPRNLVVDHNTFIATDGSGVVMADKRATEGFVFTNNVARHQKYGIIGSGYGIGLSTIGRYFPGSVITRNVFAGGSASYYPTGNLFPSIASFEAHFSDYAGGDFTLAPGTDWAQAGTDGVDLGADTDELQISTSPGTPATADIVLRTAQLSRVVGTYQLRADATAAGGHALWHPNKAAASMKVPSATPATFAEFTFVAEAGRKYYVWLRGRAEWNDPANDSVHLQFTNVSEARIGTTSSIVINLEEQALAGLSGWGWQDRGYGAGVIGAPITFTVSGTQTLRLQPREDGLLVDQIVISADRFTTAAPGAPKNDTTIVE